MSVRISLLCAARPDSPAEGSLRPEESNGQLLRQLSEFAAARYPALFEEVSSAVQSEIPFPTHTDLEARFAALLLIKLVCEAQLLLRSAGSLDDFAPLFLSLTGESPPGAGTADILAAIEELPTLNAGAPENWAVLAGSRLLNEILIRRRGETLATLIPLLRGISRNGGEFIYLSDSTTSALTNFIGASFPEVFDRLAQVGRDEEAYSLNTTGWLILTLAAKAQRTLRAGASLGRFESFLRDLSGGEVSEELKEEFRLSVQELPECENPTPETWTAVFESRLVCLLTSF